MQELTPFRPSHATPQAFCGKVLRAPWAGTLYMGEWAYPRAWKEGICICTQSYNFITQVLAFHVHINKTPKILWMGCMSSQIGETSWHGMGVNPEQLYQPSHCPVCFRGRDPWRPMLKAAGLALCSHLEFTPVLGLQHPARMCEISLQTN